VFIGFCAVWYLFDTKAFLRARKLSRPAVAAADNQFIEPR
jgi:hypothetical protein